MNTRLFFVALSLITLLISCQSSIQGEGEADTVVDYPATSYDKIEAKGKFKLILLPTDSSYVSVQTHPNLLENLVVETSGKTLTIKEKNPVDNFEKYVVYGYYKQAPQHISLEEKVLLETGAPLVSEQFTLEAKDQTLVRQFDLSSKETELEATQKAEITIKGKTIQLSLAAADFGVLNLEDLTSKTAEVDLEDESEATVNVSKELNGSVKQNASLVYKGDPEKDVDVKDRGTMNTK